MFEPFFTTRRNGSGLGLAIARNVVEGLGGTIGVRSQVGIGTTVWVDLPDPRAATGDRA
jgi:two-component system sensor histidine kinase FlrB